MTAPQKAHGWYVKGYALNGLTRYEEAIESYDQALHYEPNYASAWTGRGSVLHNLGHYEEAALHHEQALQDDPNIFSAWYGHGIALGQLANYEAAISDYEQALQLKPNYPEAWWSRGIALANLRRYEEAILNYDNALRLQPTFFNAWVSRGFAILNSALSTRHYGWSKPTLVAESLPPELQNPDMDLRDYKGWLACFQEGFKHIPEGSEDKGNLHRGLGEAHRIWGNRQDNPYPHWNKAIESYNQALKIFTTAAFPRQRLEILTLLIRTYRNLQTNNETVNALVREGSALLLRLLREASSDSHKQRLGLQFASFGQATVDLLVQQESIIEALETAERDKNWLMTWLLHWQDPDEITTANYLAMQQLLQPHTAIVYWHLSADALTTFVVCGDKQQPSVISQAQDDSQTGIRHVQKLEAWIKDWDDQYADYRSKDRKAPSPNHSWRKDMGQRLFDRQDQPGNLKTILNITAIESHLNGINHLILVPHRDLHRFPLHALFDSRFVVTYLPSLQVGLARLDWEPTHPGSILSIGNPTNHPDTNHPSDLRSAFLEAQMIRQYFWQGRSLTETAATYSQIKDTINEKYTVLHFSGHGGHQFDNPKQSALLLAQGKETEEAKHLTLEDICQQDFTSYDLVSLSACETAIATNQSITTEYVGLVSGFLSQGAAQVISTLWVVQSEACAVIMLEFYRARQLGNGSQLTNPSDAQILADTIQWFCNLDGDRFKQWRKDCRIYLNNLPSEDSQDTLRQVLDRKLRWVNIKPEVQSPYTWAAFTLSGGFF
ncbi:MAG: CHAT domain-containing protein [Cyanothece sp. SIO2G6]|nr:CHAT domain-containing protein [Cyanothece sp. SIO2G6]